MDTGERACQELERDDRSPTLARRQVASACAGLPPDTVDTAVLLTSELVTNAIHHGAGRVLLSIVRGREHVRVEVRDDGGGTPQSQGGDLDAESGRGLLLLEGLATSWDIADESDGLGTLVSFTLER